MNYPQRLACFMAYAVLCIQGDRFEITTFVLVAMKFIRKMRIFHVDFCILQNIYAFEFTKIIFFFVKFGAKRDQGAFVYNERYISGFPGIFPIF